MNTLRNQQDKALTLEQVGAKAGYLYDRYRSLQVSLATTKEWAAEQPADDYEGTLNSPDKIVDALARDAETTRRQHESFSQEHGSELYELAVILAHVEGKTINLENPITIGKKLLRK